MRIESENFRVWFDETSGTIYFDGALRLANPLEYRGIRELMIGAYGLVIGKLFLDFRDLEFLNSSGISALCQFIFEAKKIGTTPIQLVGNEHTHWQKRSFGSLTKLWDKLEVTFK